MILFLALTHLFQTHVLTLAGNGNLETLYSEQLTSNKLCARALDSWQLSRIPDTHGTPAPVTSYPGHFQQPSA